MSLDGVKNNNNKTIENHNEKKAQYKLQHFTLQRAFEAMIEKNQMTDVVFLVDCSEVNINAVSNLGKKQRSYTL